MERYRLYPGDHNITASFQFDLNAGKPFYAVYVNKLSQSPFWTKNVKRVTISRSWHYFFANRAFTEVMNTPIRILYFQYKKLSINAMDAFALRQIMIFVRLLEDESEILIWSKTKGEPILWKSLSLLSHSYFSAKNRTRTLRIEHWNWTRPT